MRYTNHNLDFDIVRDGSAVLIDLTLDFQPPLSCFVQSEVRCVASHIFICEYSGVNSRYLSSRTGCLFIKRDVYGSFDRDDHGI